MAMNRDFYTERAVHHGEMAGYYLARVLNAEALKDEEYAESNLNYAEEHAPGEAREAWHYALLMTPGQIDAEMKKQVMEATALDDLKF